MICNNIGVNSKNHITFAGHDVCSLAKKYGTPLYIYDEQKVRENCRTYKNAMEKYFPSALRIKPAFFLLQKAYRIHFSPLKAHHFQNCSFLQ